jgi:orotidine-5'-phosphate decarboxylase
MPSPFSFLDKLRRLQRQKQSRLCIGLDPDLPRLPPHLTDSYPPEEAILHFCRAIIDATAPLACAFKVNLAFFEGLGSRGWQALEAVFAALPPDVVSIADAKRGDIGNTARFYAHSLFDHLGADAATVAPYMGRDSVAPFLQFPGKGTFVLARTSNPGASDFQERACGGEPLYLHVARAVNTWGADTPGAAGLVVGATHPAPLRALREACPTLPFLIPGVGAQGGTLADVLQAATDDGLILVNSSRQVLYASTGMDFAEAAAREAATLRNQLG